MNRPPVLLIGWSAADWKLLHPLLDAGLMPHLQALIAGGVMGNLTAPSPLVPEILWASLATGRRAAGHGILAGSWSNGPERAALARRNCPAFWDHLQAHDLKTHLINWSLTAPAEDIGGVCVSDAFFADTPNAGSPPLAVWPDQLRRSLEPWRVDPREVDVETIRFFVPEFHRVPQEYDVRLRRIAHAVARSLSVQAVTTWLMENKEWNVIALRFDLLEELAPWALPLTAPKLDTVNQLEFELYRHVLAGACRTLDLLLGALVRLAGPDAMTALVSDHGLLLGEARPGRSPRDLENVENWRRREGIIVISGAGCRSDEVIFGAKLLDVAPTLLAFLGIPTLPSCEGRVLTEAFEPPPAPVLSPTAQEFPQHSEAPPLPAIQSSEEEIQSSWNLARSQLDASRLSEATKLIESLHRARPDNLDFLYTLFECELALKQLEPAREKLEALLDHLWGTPQASLLQARMEYVARRFDLSLQHLESIGKGEKPLPRVELQIGLNLVKLNRSVPARAHFVRELEARPDCAEAKAGLAYCYLRAGEYDEAISHAEEAIALNYQLYHAHFLLGLAQARQGQVERAIIAFKLVATLVPNFAPAHRCLSILLGRNHAQQELAERHKDLAKAARNWSWGF